MGQYRPSGLIPSTLTSDYTIDATVANDFRCRINGTSPTTKYQLKIVKNDAASTAVYDSGVVTLDSPLYPVNYDGTQNELVVSVPASSTMENGNEYKWTMTSYWSDDDKYESYENVFKAYAAATISITNFVDVMTTRSYTFTASVTQAQGIGVERFGWIIRNKDTGEETVNTIDENNIYSSDIRVSYDGFLSGTTEEIKVKCWLNDGTSVETEFQQFTVNYQLVTFENLVNTEVRSDSGVDVRWNKLNYIDGSATGDNYEYVQDGREGYRRKYIHIGQGSSVVFDTVNTAQMAFPSSVSHVVGFWVDGANSSIYKASGVDSNGDAYYIELKSTDTDIILNINGVSKTLFSKTVIQKWYTVIIEPTRVRGIEWSEDEPIYPRDDLYPGGFYPRYIISPFVKAYTDVDIDAGGTWNSISASGDVLMRYIWIEDRAITDADVEYLGGATLDDEFDDEEKYLKNLIATGDHGQQEWAKMQLELLYNDRGITNIPVWDNETLLLAIFDGNFRAGNIASDVPVTGWIVYSIEEGSSFLKPVISVGATVNGFTDYTVRNQTGMMYYVFPVFGDKIGASASSNVVTPNWWDWSLIVCDKVNDDTYYQNKTYRFDLDVSSGSMSNNTTFNELQNFTRYAKVQNSSSNYWSGTLSAFIGNCGVTYKDTVEQMDELKALTTDNRDKFLKDRKGNMWKVRLNSAVSEKTTDEYVEQAVVVTLGWMEIGDASNAVITNKM